MRVAFEEVCPEGNGPFHRDNPDGSIWTHETLAYINREPEISLPIPVWERKACDDTSWIRTLRTEVALSYNCLP
jgi:hypothetical protein